MAKIPFVSIIIVTYNGRHLLQECLDSVFSINYPNDRFEVILVDNNSSDNSISYVKKKFSKIILVESSENLGFTGGNNLGYEKAKGEYIVMLNSDTRVDENWLKFLVETASKPNVGLVSSKLYLATPFIELNIKSKTISRSDIDFSPIGVLVEDVVCQNPDLNSLVWYEQGFYPREDAVVSTQWTNGSGKVLLPFADPKQETYFITLHGHLSTQKLETKITLKMGKKRILSDKLNSNQVKQFTLTISKKDAKKNFIWLIQNAGNNILHDGHGKDRGSIIKIENKKRLEFYERDSQYFNKPVNLLAACGASCLVKKEVIDQVKFLDGYYFMYYEDLELSLRAWKMGWDIMYEPRSIVYHKHKATTGKISSPFFETLIERNHLVFILTHFSFFTFLTGFFIFMFNFFLSFFFIFILTFRENISMLKFWSARGDGRWKTLKYLAVNFVRLYRSKKYWKQNEKRSLAQFKNYLH